MVILCLILRNRKLFSMVASVHFSYYFSIPALVTQLVSGCHPRAGMVLGSGDSRGTCSVGHTGTDNSKKHTNAWRGRPLFVPVYLPIYLSYQLLWFSTNLMTLPQHPSLPAQFKNLSTHLQAERSPFQTLLIPHLSTFLKMTSPSLKLVEPLAVVKL